MSYFSSSANFYLNQLDRVSAHARRSQTTAAAMTTATARMALRTQAAPTTNTPFIVMRWTTKDGEILPEFVSEIDGPAMPRGFSDFAQRAEYRGRLNVQRVLVEFPDAVAVPRDMAFMWTDTRLTPSNIESLDLVP